MIGNFLARLADGPEDQTRETLRTLRSSPEWEGLTQRAFRERMAKRNTLIAASEHRQAAIRKRMAATAERLEAATRRMDQLQDEFQAAIENVNQLQRESLGASSVLGHEQGSLRCALQAYREPAIEQVRQLAAVLEDSIRLKLWTVVRSELNIIGGRIIKAGTNMPDVVRATERLRAIADELSTLNEGAYPEDLFDLLAEHYSEMEQMAQSFEVLNERSIAARLKPAQADS